MISKWKKNYFLQFLKKIRDTNSPFRVALEVSVLQHKLYYLGISSTYSFMENCVEKFTMWILKENLEA